MSRSYYSAFLYLRERVRLIHVIAPEVHRELLRELLRLRMFRAAYELRLLRYRRNTADYDLKARITRQDAKEAVRRARRVLGMVP